MCGIAGIIDAEGVDTSDLKRMSDVLKHRGPDDEGFVLIDPDSNYTYLKGRDSIESVQTFSSINDYNTRERRNIIGFLHRRLSIIDLSAAAHQPMEYHRGRYLITYNGEVYNFRELRSELLAKGYEFKSDSDTEVILASYAEWGSDCVKKFIGMWAFAIHDTEKKKIFLSRDRFGIKPLYYSCKENKIAFASEIKALLSLEFITSKANYISVIEYISYGSTSTPSGNLYSDICQLPPAHNLIIDLCNFSVTKEEYYNLNSRISDYSFQDLNFAERFGTLFEQSIKLHLVSDVPVGTCLSGGLDSSSIVAFAAPLTGKSTFKTFTASYEDKAIDESGYAKAVSAHFKNIDPYYTFPNIENYWAELDKFTWYQDLPVHSTSMYAQWEVMKLAHHEKIKVVLNGQGSDEILGGYYNFAGIYLIELMKKGKWNSFIREYKNCRKNFTPTVLKDIGRAFYYFLPGHFQQIIRAEKRLGPAFISKEFRNQLKEVKIPERGGKNFRDNSLQSIKYGLQNLLRYEDRNSMAFSVESRVPFLDHRLVEFSIALDNEWKVKEGWSKYILRKAVEPRLPKQVVWRKNKMGFLTPQKGWKRKLQEQLTDYVSQTPLPPLFDKKYMLQLCSSDLNEASHLSEFWKMISFIKWAEVFKVTF